MVECIVMVELGPGVVMLELVSGVVEMISSGRGDVNHSVTFEYSDTFEYSGDEDNVNSVDSVGVDKQSKLNVTFSN